jgi:isopentenyl-diphosphate delta-isomerase
VEKKNSQVILVNENDEQIGVMEKMQAHREGLLHRAFSVFVLNDENKMLLQKRAADKYHSANLWTNACCSHPMPEENIIDAANRRVKEELGMQIKNFENLFSFQYKAELENNLIEHELDYVLWAVSDEKANLNLEEASEVNYFSKDEIKKWLASNPEQFTAWFKLIFPKIENRF